MLRRVLKTAGLVGLALGLVAAAAVIWQLARDPLDALPRVSREARSHTLERERADGREWRRVRLEVDGHGSVALQISLPHPLPAQPLPVVLVLGGLKTGADSVRHLPEAGSSVLVGYDWPIPRRVPRDITALRMLPDSLNRLLSVPGEISVALRWLAAQPWADRERVSLVGLSLGALAAPAVQRVAAADGLAINWTVLGYGGAPLDVLIADHPRVRAGWFRPLLRAVAALVLRPLEPAHHLPHLEGAFLVLGGTGDGFIPEPAARHFADLTPEPKTVTWIDGGHLGVGRDRDALLAEVINQTVRWLRAQDAVDTTRSERERAFAARSGSGQVARQFSLELGEVARDHRHVEACQDRLLRLAVQQEQECRLETALWRVRASR